MNLTIQESAGKTEPRRDDKLAKVEKRPLQERRETERPLRAVRAIQTRPRFASVNPVIFWYTIREYIN